MIVYNRREKILEYLSREGVASVDKLSDTLKVSLATIRRDLANLAKSGKILRVHGGAVANNKISKVSRISERMEIGSDEKVAVGKAAADIICSGDNIFLGSGTTVLEVARAILNRNNLSNLKVVTNSIPIMNLFLEKDHISVIVTGGSIYRQEQSMTGSLTQQALEHIHVDKTFIGIRAFNVDNGLMSDDEWEVQSIRSVLKIGRQVILVGDHSKFKILSTIRICPPSDIDVIITDGELDKETITRLESKGLKVITATVE